MEVDGTGLLRCLDSMGVWVPLNSDALAACLCALRKRTAFPCLAQPAVARGTEPSQHEPRLSLCWCGPAQPARGSCELL